MTSADYNYQISLLTLMKNLNESVKIEEWTDTSATQFTNRYCPIILGL